MTTMKMPKVKAGKAVSSGSTKPVMLPKIDPEMPRKKAEMDQATSLWRSVWMPMASAFSSSSRMAFMARPKRDRKSDVAGKGVAVWVDFGGARGIKKKKKQ